VQHLPYAMAWQAEAGVTKAASAAPPLQKDPHKDCAAGAEEAGGIGWECRELLSAAGMHSTGGQGTRLSWSQARSAEASDTRSLKCFSLIQASLLHGCIVNLYPIS